MCDLWCVYSPVCPLLCTTFLKCHLGVSLSNIWRVLNKLRRQEWHSEEWHDFRFVFWCPIMCNHVYSSTPSIRRLNLFYVLHPPERPHMLDIFTLLMEIFLHFWINKHPPNECDYALLIIVQEGSRTLPTISNVHRCTTPNISTKDLSSISFYSDGTNVSSCWGMCSERGEKIWLIHKLWTKLGCWKWLIQGLGMKGMGKVVGGPGIKRGQEGWPMLGDDYAWLSFFFLFFCLPSVFVFVYLSAPKSLRDMNP